MRPLGLSWPVVILLSAAAAVEAVVVDASPAVRVPLLLWFLGLCPGLALIRLLRLDDPVWEVSLSVALSLSLLIAITTVMIYTGRWSPTIALFVLAGISAVGALAQLLGVGRRRALRN
jgi:hypothetical protein